MKKLTAFATLFGSFIVLGTTLRPLNPLAQPTLKEAYKNYFPIGVAVNPRMVMPGLDAELIKPNSTA